MQYKKVCNMLEEFWSRKHACTHARTRTHTNVLRLSGFCLGQPRWAGTRRNIHSLTPITV